jgi:hypothetical protein
MNCGPSLRPCGRLRPKPAGPAWMTARSTFGTLLSATRRSAPRGFEPSDRPSDAGTPAFPLGFPSPAADSSECPPESPAAATPPESPSHHRPHPYTLPPAASAPAPSRSASPAGPPAPPQTDDDRAHSQAPPPPSREAHLHSPKRALSSPFASYAHRSLPLPPFFASTRVESMATASTFPFPSVYPQSGRACRIWCQTPFSWSS